MAVARQSVSRHTWSAVSPEWKSKVRAGKGMELACGGGAGNEGVTAQVQQSQYTGMAALQADNLAMAAWK